MSVPWEVRSLSLAGEPTARAVTARATTSDSNFKQHKHSSAISPHHLREVFLKHPALGKKEGAGKTGCALHPRSRVQYVQKNAHTSIQVQRKHSGLPCAMALRLISRSPR